MIVKIISGGQTGADIAGLCSAKHLELETGGFAPQGWRTEDGKNILLGSVFGLIEDSVYDYKSRTLKNIKHSDGTVWFGKTDSPGAKCTINGIKKENKPSIVNPTSNDFIKWIDKNDIKVLNVAGNRESSRPGIFKRVYDFLVYNLTNYNDILKGIKNNGPIS